MNGLIFWRSMWYTCLWPILRCQFRLNSSFFWSFYSLAFLIKSCITFRCAFRIVLKFLLRIWKEHFPSHCTFVCLFQTILLLIRARRLEMFSNFRMLGGALKFWSFLTLKNIYADNLLKNLRFSPRFDYCVWKHL